MIQDNKVTKRDDLNDEAISAFEYNNRKRSHNNNKKKQQQNQAANDPIKLLKDGAKRLGLSNLMKKTELVKFEKGFIYNTSEKKFLPEDVTFERKKLQNFWDISLKSDDEMEIKAHKCILVARLEYFNCMISQGWMEVCLIYLLYLLG